MSARQAAISATIDAIRMLDLATARYRVTLAADWGVTVTDSVLMSNIALAGGAMTPRDLARRMLISSGTVTTMVDRLESAGLVERTANPADRRSLLVELTDKGRESLFYTRERFINALDDSMPDDHAQEFADTLRQIAESIDGVTNAMIAEHK